MFAGSWRNRGPSWAMYVQHCRLDELRATDTKLFYLLIKYGAMFDDEWYYWIAKNSKWIRRVPLIMAQNPANAKERHWYEKPRRYEPNKTLF